METHNIVENTQQDKNKKGNQIKKVTKWGSDDENDQLQFNDNVETSDKTVVKKRAANTWNQPLKVQEKQYSNDHQEKAKILADKLGEQNTQNEQKKVVKKVQKPKESAQDLNKWMSRAEEDEEKKRKQIAEELLKKLEEEDNKKNKVDSKTKKTVTKNKDLKKTVTKKNDTKKKTTTKTTTKKTVIKKKQSIGGTGVTSGKTWDE